MTIKEVEELLQITRANIRFYEQEGLLTPNRSKNGYRSYSNDDVAQLKKVILFRKLGVPLSDIKKIFDQEVTISDVMSQNLRSLNQQFLEIKGAIDVCNQIQQDTNSDISFDYERYWNIIEQKESAGNPFFETFKDYMLFEGHTLKRMWGSVFFYDLDASVKKRGWFIALAIVFVICIIRGLACQYLWKYGTFWYGFTYPFILFLLISGITLPLYILNHKYGEKEEVDESKKSKFLQIPLLGLWKFLGMIFAFFLLLFGVPIFWEKVIYNEVLYKGTNYIITGSPFILYIIVALYLFIMPIWLYAKNDIFGNAFSNEGGFKSHLPKRMKKKVMAFTVLIYLVTVVIYGTWYNVITDDGITQKHFWMTKNDSWDDVSYYSLSASFDGTMKYSIVLKDKTPILLLGNSSSASNFDKKEYPGGDEDFVLQLTKKFTEQHIPIKINSWEKLHKQLKYDYWDEFAEEIRAIAINH